MSTFYDPEKIRALAATGDKFYQGAWWILRQQEAAQITGKPRASFMSDKISMDEAREKAAAEKFGPAPSIADRERHLSERAALMQAAADRVLESLTQARERFAFRQEHDPAREARRANWDDDWTPTPAA